MADETKLTAATRLEKLLDNIAGGDNEVTPATRLEKFLSYIADAMEGGGGSGGGGTGGNVYNIEQIPDSEFAEGGAFYNLTIDDLPVIAGKYIDADTDVNAGDIVEYETPGDFNTITQEIVALKNTYVDIPEVGTVKEVTFGGTTYAENVATDSEAVTYNGKYFILTTSLA